MLYASTIILSWSQPSRVLKGASTTDLVDKFLRSTSSLVLLMDCSVNSVLRSSGRLSQPFSLPFQIMQVNSFRISCFSCSSKIFTCMSMSWSQGWASTSFAVNLNLTFFSIILFIRSIASALTKSLYSACYSNKFQFKSFPFEALNGTFPQRIAQRQIPADQMSTG